MNTLTKSILVVALFAALTATLLLVTGTFTGQMDHRWNMAMYGMRGTTWLIVPFVVTLGLGFVVLWLVHRSKRLVNPK